MNSPVLEEHLVQPPGPAALQVAQEASQGWHEALFELKKPARQACGLAAPTDVKGAG